MEMEIARMATAQKAAETSNAVGIALLKQAQQAGEEQAQTLLDSIPKVSPPVSGMGSTVDISV